MIDAGVFKEILPKGESLTVEFKSDRKQISDNEIYENVVARRQPENRSAALTTRMETRRHTRGLSGNMSWNYAVSPAFRLQGY